MKKQGSKLPPFIMESNYNLNARPNTIFGLRWSKLFLIDLKFFNLFSLPVLSSICVLFGICLLIVILDFITIDLTLYFNTYLILPITSIIYLVYKDMGFLIKLVLNSLCVIANILLLSLILAIIIFIFTNWLSFNLSVLSFEDSFNISRGIFGFILSLRLGIHTLKLIYVNRKNPRELFQHLFLLFLSLTILGFFILFWRLYLMF